MQVDTARRATDAALKAAGIHARGVSALGHGAAEQLASAWGTLSARLRLSPLSSAASAASATAADAPHTASARAGAMTDRLLKQLGLRDRSTLESAADSVHGALHSLRLAVGADDPTTAELLARACAGPQHALHAALASLTAPLTSASSSSASSFHLPHLPHLPASLTYSVEQLGAALKSGVGYPAGAHFSADGLTETVRAAARWGRGCGWVGVRA